MGDFPIVPPEPQAAPLSYELSSHQRFTPLAVSAVFDGTAAAGDFLPCCSIYAPGGQLIGRTFPGTVTAGSSAEVTYTPFARAGGSGGGGAGIEFNKDNQGGYLDITTNNADPQGLAMKIVANVDGDTWLGVPADGTQGTRTGNVVITTGYAGQRATVFQYDNDAGGVNRSAVIYDDRIDVVNHRLDRVGVISKGTVPLAPQAGKLLLLITAAGSVTVVDSAFNPVFEVRDDGSLHGKTGQTLTFDL